MNSVKSMLFPRLIAVFLQFSSPFRSPTAAAVLLTCCGKSSKHAGAAVGMTRRSLVKTYTPVANAVHESTELTHMKFS